MQCIWKQCAEKNNPKPPSLKNPTTQTYLTCLTSGSRRQEPAGFLLYTELGLLQVTELRTGTLSKGEGQPAGNLGWCLQCISPSKQSLRIGALGDWTAVSFLWQTRLHLLLKGEGLSASRNSAGAEKCGFCIRYLSFLAPDSHQIWKGYMLRARAASLEMLPEHEHMNMLLWLGDVLGVWPQNHRVCYSNRRSQTALHTTLDEENLEVLKLRMSAQNKIKPVRTEAEIISKHHWRILLCFNNPPTRLEPLKIKKKKKKIKKPTPNKK